MSSWLGIVDWNAFSSMLLGEQSGRYLRHCPPSMLAYLCAMLVHGARQAPPKPLPLNRRRSRSR